MMDAICLEWDGTSCRIFYRLVRPAPTSRVQEGMRAEGEMGKMRGRR